MGIAEALVYIVAIVCGSAVALVLFASTMGKKDKK